MSKFILAIMFAAVCLVGPAVPQSEAHHCHHRNFFGSGNNNYGYGGGGTFIDRLLGNGYGGYGRNYGGGFGRFVGNYGGNNYYPGNSYFGHHHHRGCGW